MTSTGTLVLPIGQFYGTFYNQVGSTERVHTVRLATALHDLDEPRLTVWALLHGVPDRLGDGGWSRDDVRALAPGLPVDQILSGLIADGLAAEVGPDDLVDFAHRHRMGHRMLGLGNTSEEPWQFSIGFFDHPVVRVTREVYELWDLCALADSLWEACEKLAKAERDADQTDPAKISPEALLRGFLGTAHHLLAMSVVYLEPRR